MAAKKIVSNYDRQVDLARAIFLQHDQAPLIRKFRLTADNDYLYLHYFRIPFRICRKSGRVDEQIAGNRDNVGGCGANRGEKSRVVRPEFLFV